MGTDILRDKLSIKNLLFTKALPNYTISIPTDGHTIFPCTDCGDKFLFESSYKYHITRKSVKITYTCRYCGITRIFENRCQLLFHIRSHAFKSATINVSDLKIEPLGLEEFPTENSDLKVDKVIPQLSLTKYNKCYECDQNIDTQDIILFKGRANHYMKHTSEFYSCPICLHKLPSTCAISAHLRIHLKIPPYFCPECGILIPNRFISYPYNHDCDGFKTIRNTTRHKCTFEKCDEIFHPKDFQDHFKTHVKIIYKCRTCLYETGGVHMNCNGNLKDRYFICPLCPNQTFMKQNIDKHLNVHFNTLKNLFINQVYPCPVCQIVYQNISELLDHQINDHDSGHIKNILPIIFSKIFNDKNSKKNSSGLYRVVKKCEKCLRTFSYRCEYENIGALPTACPYSCSKTNVVTIPTQTDNNLEKQSQTEIDVNINVPKVVCFLCTKKLNEDWNYIKTHFKTFHKQHKCLDIKVDVERLDPKSLKSKVKSKHFGRKYGNVKQLSKKNQKNLVHPKKVPSINKNVSKNTGNQNEQRNQYICNICNFKYSDKNNLKSHIVSHRDHCMAYQCMECGKCFVVKPSFSTHLVLEHRISDVDDYIAKNNQCYNESALLKYLPASTLSDVLEPIKENQCQICREQFNNINDFEKHFRVHGMAFLMKNTNKSP